MRPVMVDIPYAREFPHPIGDCFAWLTDYSEADPSLTSAVLKGRRVVERNADRVILEVDNVIAGRPARGRAEVRLFPAEHRYEARSLHGDGGAILYTYELTALGPNRTRLEVHYLTRVRRVWGWLKLTVAKPLAKRDIARMWDGFAASMAKDLAAQEKGTGTKAVEA